MKSDSSTGRRIDIGAEEMSLSTLSGCLIDSDPLVIILSGPHRFEQNNGMRLSHVLLLLVTIRSTETSFESDMSNFFSGIWDSLKGFGSDIKSSLKSLTDDLEKWDCGADKFSDDINRSCRYHDFCYSNGVDGQTACDDRFCSQLLSLKIIDPVERELCTLPSTLCEAVRVGGHLVYQNKFNT